MRSDDGDTDWTSASSRTAGTQSQQSSPREQRFILSETDLAHDARLFRDVPMCPHGDEIHLGVLASIDVFTAGEPTIGVITKVPKSFRVEQAGFVLTIGSCQLSLRVGVRPWVHRMEPPMSWKDLD